ncbi:MAG TPA: peptidyl-prolyl cis-trans isomerase [Xanthobacteraceae bacterium]|nr:peptidyl-prolyl cis-trans isomerase [Xanthobacteraceae bacterium]
MNVHEPARPEAAPAGTKVPSGGGFWDFTQVSPLRSMICFGLASAIGLAIAGFGLFTAKGTVTHVVPPENVALVNQRPILRTDFIAQAEAELGKPFAEATTAERLKVLDEMLREELFVQRGLELDFPGTDPDTRTALVAAVEQQVVADVTTHQPGDAELQKYFEDNRSSYATEGTMTLHNLVLPKASGSDAMATAQKAADALRAHTPVEEVVKTYGLQEMVPEHASGEQFYFAQKIHLGEPLYELALTLNDGDVSKPVAAADGIHVVQMVKHVKPLPLTFERVRSQVLNDYITAEKKRLEDGDLRYLRDKADILIADDYAADYEKSQAEKNAEAAKTADATKP